MVFSLTKQDEVVMGTTESSTVAGIYFKSHESYGFIYSLTKDYLSDIPTTLSLHQ